MRDVDIFFVSVSRSNRSNNPRCYQFWVFRDWFADWTSWLISRLIEANGRIQRFNPYRVNLAQFGGLDDETRKDFDERMSRNSSEEN